MKRLIGVFVVFASSLAVTAGAEVNCKQVNKYLQTGRTPQDVSDTMVISVDDVKKCQEAEKSAGGAPAAAAPAAPAAPANPAAPDAAKK